MITRLYADNFRCLSNFELKLGSMALLVGDNGTGKSSVLAVMERLCRIASDPTADLGELMPWSTLTRWDRRTEQHFELDIVVAERAYRYTLRLAHDTSDASARILAESIQAGERTIYSCTDGSAVWYREDGNIFELPLRAAAQRSLLALFDFSTAEHEILRVRDALSRCATLRLDPTRIAADAPREVDRIAADGHDFARWYLHFVTSAPSAQGPLFTTLAAVLPGFQALRFDGRGANRTLYADFAAGSTRYALRFDELSEGQRALIVLYALLAGLGADGTLWIDEPVNHIALGEIQPWLFEALERLDTGGQIVLVSHHPDLIDFMAAREAIVFHRPHGGPTRVMPLTVDRDEALRASDVIRKRLIADD
ncbi:MAG: AAA family ATPase [bacterium]|nr:AAA family ATPase [Myxococcales bacterium]